MKGLRIAYLINRYPAASHSFIRREIKAVEAAGGRVDRWSVRPPQGDLPDSEDQAERTKTRYILGAGTGVGKGRLIAAAASFALRCPVLFLKGLKTSWVMAEGNPRSIVKSLAYLVEACFLISAFKRDKVDHVHAHFGTNPTAVARLVWALGGPAYSFTVHGPDEFDNPAGLDLAGKIADAAAVFAISSFGRSQLMRWSLPRHWPRIHIARCGVDDAFIGADAAVPTPDLPILCCIARLSGQKGIPLLIEAAALVKAQCPAFQLLLVGDGDMRAEIEQQISQLGLAETVTILGWCDEKAVRAALLQARAMVLPSFAEGLPVVIMEALALRRPVIVTAIAGTPELVDASCGWLIPAGSVEAAAEAMLEAVSAAPERLAAMGEEGRRRVLLRHNAGRNGVELYEEIERSRTGTPAS